MTIRPLTRSIALASGAGLAVVPLAFAATPSLAAADCGEGTEVAAGICEKAYTTAGDYTFSVPSSVAKMSAVLVGGGQGGVALLFEGSPLGAYGGSGGGVVFVDSVSLSAPITLAVGEGGASTFFGSDAGDTILGDAVAGGAFVNEDVGVFSGSPQENPAYIVATGPPVTLYSGAGAGGTPTTCAGGSGVTASSVAAGSSLFPPVLGEPVYGSGGSCSGTLTSTNGAGQGGNAFFVGSTPSEDAGKDGAVIFRWASASLPDTGVSVQPWLIGASVAGVLGGAILASGALRTRRRGRHSA